MEVLDPVTLDKEKEEELPPVSYCFLYAPGEELGDLIHKHYGHRWCIACLDVQPLTKKQVADNHTIDRGMVLPYQPIS